MDCLKIRKGILSLVIMISASFAGFSQNGSIEGVATDKKSKETLPGVTITIDGTTIGYKVIRKFPLVKTSKIKITISKAKASPVISNIELYRAPGE